MEAFGDENGADAAEMKHVETKFTDSSAMHESNGMDSSIFEGSAATNENPLLSRTENAAASQRKSPPQHEEHSEILPQKKSSKRMLNIIRFVRLIPAFSVIALSSFQYGYNQGVINAPYQAISKCTIPEYQDGAFFRDCIPMNTLQWSFAVSAMNIGALFTAITAPFLSDYTSRNSALYYANFLNILGVFLMCCFSEFGTFIAGRFFTGMASGVFSGVAGIYLTEIATQHTRGIAGSFFGIGITSGLLFQAVLGIFLSEPGVSWRILMAGSVVASFGQLIFLPCIPKSPRFLMLRYVKRTLNYDRKRRRKERTTEDHEALPTHELDSLALSREGVRGHQEISVAAKQKTRDDTKDRVPSPHISNRVQRQDSFRSTSTVDLDDDEEKEVTDTLAAPPGVHASISQLSLDDSDDASAPAAHADTVGAPSTHIELYAQLPPAVQIFRQETLYSLAFYRYGATDEELHQEMEEIESSIRDMAQQKSGLRELFGKWRNLWKLFVAVFLQGSMQTCGLALVLSYSLMMFETAGLPRGDILNAVVIFADFVAAFFAGLLFEKIGRRRSLILTQFFMTLSIIVLATSFVFAKEHLAWGIVSVAAMVFFVIFFSMGLAPLAVLLSVEIFPNTIRGYGVSGATFANWFMLTIVTFIFPIYSEWSERFSLIPFAVFNIGFLLFYILFVPETKGKSLDRESGKLAKVSKEHVVESEMDDVPATADQAEHLSHVDKVQLFEENNVDELGAEER